MTKIENVVFENNIAQIAGGALYVPNNYEKKSLNISKCVFNNNVGKTYGNDYTTEVSYIKINDTDINTNIISGDYIPLIYYLYDEYNKTINDNFNMYSSISINVYIYDNNDNEYILHGNKCTFYKGKI